MSLNNFYSMRLGDEKYQRDTREFKIGLIKIINPSVTHIKQYE